MLQETFNTFLKETSKVKSNKIQELQSLSKYYGNRPPPPPLPMFSTIFEEYGSQIHCAH